MRKDVLASGARSAQFFTGDNGEEVELHNMSSEPREDFIVPLEEKQITKKHVPLGNTVLIKRAEGGSTGAIILTEVDQPAQGIVRAIGDKVTDVIIGDDVVFGKYAGVETQATGELLVLLQVEDILSKLVTI